MPPIVTSAEIGRPAADVFAYATDPARFSEWQKGVVDGHMDSPVNGSPAVGAKCVTTRRIGGASRPSTSELVHIDPPRTWGVRGTDGPIRAAVDVLVEPVTDSRSRLTISVDFAGHGMGKILVPLIVRREARKEMPANMAALKERMENGLSRQDTRGRDSG
jgi:Polyketide cyclase / dehydrase and lipid transport